MPIPDSSRTIIIRRRELVVYMLSSIYMVGLATIALIVFFDLSSSRLLTMIALVVMASLFPSAMVFYRSLVRGETYETTLTGEKLSAEAWKTARSDLLKRDVRRSSRIWILCVYDPLRFLGSVEDFLSAVRHELRDVKLLIFTPTTDSTSPTKSTVDSNDNRRRQFLSQVAEQTKGMQAGIEVRYYHTQPLFSLLVLDDLVYAIFHPQDSTQESGVYKFKGHENDLRRLLYGYFLTVWKTATVCDLDDLAQQSPPAYPEGPADAPSESAEA